MFSLNLSEEFRILHPFLSFFLKKIRGLRFITKRPSKPETAFLQDTLPRGIQVQTEPNGSQRAPARPQRLALPRICFGSLTQSRHGGFGICDATSQPEVSKSRSEPHTVGHISTLLPEAGTTSFNQHFTRRGDNSRRATPAGRRGSGRPAQPGPRVTNPSEAGAAAPQIRFLPVPRGDTSPPSRSGEPGGFSKPSPHQHPSGPGTGPQQLPPSPSPLPEVVHLAEDLLVLDVAAVLLPQRGAAHGALQAADVPDEVVHLRQRSG